MPIPGPIRSGTPSTAVSGIPWRWPDPDWEAEATRINPDGDVAIPEDQLDGFRTVDCLACGQDHPWEIGDAFIEEPG